MIDAMVNRSVDRNPLESVLAWVLIALFPLFFIFVLVNFFLAFLAYPYYILKTATRNAPGVPQVGSK
jgi:hypothetical protein